jgi:hypothetical protein
MVVDELCRDGHPPNKDTPIPTPPTLPHTLPRQSFFDTGLNISIDLAILNDNEDSPDDFQSTLGESEERGGVSISLEEEVAEYQDSGSSSTEGAPNNRSEPGEPVTSYGNFSACSQC